MKKFIKPLSFLLVVILLLSTTGCFLVGGVTSDVDNEGNPLLSYNYREYEAEALTALADTLEELLTLSDQWETVMSVHTDYMAGLYRARAQYVAAGLAYHKNLYSEDTTAEDAYIEMGRIYDRAAMRYYELCARANDTEYRDVFFAGMTEEDIQETLAVTAGYTEEYLTLSDQYNDILSRYYDIDMQAEDYLSQMAALYVEAVDINDRIAAQFGYDSYLYYCYGDIYEREYSPSDTQEMTVYCVEYLLPILDKATEWTEARGVSMAMQNFYYQSALQGKAKQDLDGYFASLDPRLGGIYEKFHEYDLYVASSRKEAGDIAFTDYLDDVSLPVCYFGPYYQDRLTVLHELGHFMQAYLTRNRMVSFDMIELHSQGNEMLYLAYESTVLDQALYEDIMTGAVIDQLSTIVMSHIINAFENAVYREENLTAERVIALYGEVCDQFGGLEYLTELLGYDVSEYWTYTAFSQPGYYISYAVSGISALELYFMAMEDYQTAADAYFELVSDTQDEWRTSLSKAGLSDPLSEKLYELLSEGFLSMTFMK